MTQPKSKKISKINYCQYLFATQVNYTLTNYAEHIESVTHDTINRYLRDEKLTPKLLWEHVKPNMHLSNNGYIVFDDSILDKNYSKNIESVRWQYSGNAHRIIRGIGIVNCIYINPETNQYWSIDYRVFDPERDGKSKMEHVQDMLNNVLYSKKLKFTTVLMDSWYASNKMMLFISDMNKIFYCPVKTNRLARDYNTDDFYRKIKELNWDSEELHTGKPIRLKGMPRDFAMKMYRVSVSTNRTDYVVTNDPSQKCTDDIQKVCAMRWYIEQFHRELKQLTGIEKCQCRKQRIQRNHIACAILVWSKLKKIAYDIQTTVYQLKQNLLKEYLTKELRAPTICLGFA